MTRPLRIAVPDGLQLLNPSSGVGNMWRHVLAGLRTRTHLHYREPRRRRGLRRRPDLWLNDCGFGTLPVAAPVVVQVHEAGWDDDEVRSTLDPDFLETVLEGRVGDAVRSATRIITPSESARRQVVEHWDVPPERVHSVPHGVDNDLFHPDRLGGPELVAQAGGRAGAPYVLFVSQIHPRKNLGAVRDAMTELARQGFAHQLVVVGGPAQDRPDSKELLAQAASDLPGTEGRVVVLRDVSEVDLAAVMAGASAFCLPSLMEGFGMTALEAMSCGVPVIVSDRGSLPEVVGDAGIVTEPRPGAVRDALVAVLTDEARAAELRRAGRTRALGFSWARTVQGWLAVLEAAAGRNEAWNGAANGYAPPP